MEKTIGTYVDEATGKLYKVIERTKLIEYKGLNETAKAKGPVDYYTECGIDLNPLDDETSGLR